MKRKTVYTPKNALPNNDMSVYDTDDRAKPAGRSVRTMINAGITEEIIRKHPGKYKRMIEKGGANKMIPPYTRN